MATFPVPAVSDLARVPGTTVEEARAWLWDEFYNKETIPWSYRTGIKLVKLAYRGLHNLAQLKASCDYEKIAQSKRSNAEIVELAAPLAFGRQTQVDLVPFFPPVRRGVLRAGDAHAGRW